MAKVRGYRGGGRRDAREREREREREESRRRKEKILGGECASLRRRSSWETGR